MVKLLTVKDLAYKYKNSSDYAIKNISFSAEKGDMIALIGKSGSGKTTIINSTLGLFSNIEGEVSFGEGVSVRDVDYCMQNQSVDWYLNVYDNIYMGVLYSQNTISKKNVDEIIDVLGLKGKEKSDLTELSGGQLQRVQIARSLVSNSKILFLDEPTTGLDVVLSKNILEYIKTNNKEHAVFISSHDLDLIEKYCNKIIYINDGECLYFGEMSTFLREYNKEIVYNISYSGELSKDVVEKHKDTITIVDDKNLKIFLEKEEEISNVLKLLLAENITIGNLQKEEITLKRILELEE